MEALDDHGWGGPGRSLNCSMSLHRSQCQKKFISPQTGKPRASAHVGYSCLGWMDLLNHGFCVAKSADIDFWMPLGMVSRGRLKDALGNGFSKNHASRLA